MIRQFAILLALASGALGQQPNVAAQKEALKKLSFLVGKWSGPASVSRGPGDPLKITQSEDIQMKLDGLVILLEGTGRNPDGKVAFQALATISYDETTSTYRFRAFNDGHFLDTELKVADKGFEWGYTAGPLTVKNVMRVTEKGEWSETTDSSYGTTPPRRSVEMVLKHL